MARYLISFDAHAMDHIPDEEGPAVGKASHAVVQEAVDAGVWVFGAGIEGEKASVVGTDGTVAEGRYPEAIGGFSIIDVPAREEALRWAVKIAVACRCAQEVRELMPDSEQDAMLRQAGTPRALCQLDEQLIQLREGLGHRIRRATATVGLERFLRGKDLAHDKQRLAICLRQGDRRDGAVLSAFFVGPDDARWRCHLEVPAEEVDAIAESEVVCAAGAHIHLAGTQRHADRLRHPPALE